MSICRENSGQLVCKLAADERHAFEDEVDRLGTALKAPEARVADLERNAPVPLESMLPSDEQLDRTMSMMQRFFQGFIDIVKELDPALKGADKPPAEPQRT
jgi:polyhydroxyalkanoate synthesis regulator protein